jgi:hypothetical protein
VVQVQQRDPLVGIAKSLDLAFLFKRWVVVVAVLDQQRHSLRQRWAVAALLALQLALVGTLQVLMGTLEVMVLRLAPPKEVVAQEVLVTGPTPPVVLQGLEEQGLATVLQERLLCMLQGEEGGSRHQEMAQTQQFPAVAETGRIQPPLIGLVVAEQTVLLLLELRLQSL